MEQRETKVERVRGGPSQSFWTNFKDLGAPKFDPGAPEMANIGPKWPKMAISRFRWSTKVGTAENQGGMG